MIKNACLLLMVASLFTSCKQHEAQNIEEEIYDQDKLSYKVLNTSIDSLQYNNPLHLDLNNDGTIDYFLSSVLLENDDKPYLYLFINRHTPQRNQIVAKPGEELPLNGLWAAPLNAGTSIGQVPAETYVWSELQMKTALLNVTENNNNRIFGGEWLGKKDKYLGLKFEINGKYHYGWLRISHTLNEAKLAIIDYAYNKTPERAILAGKK